LFKDKSGCHFPSLSKPSSFDSEEQNPKRERQPPILISSQKGIKKAHQNCELYRSCSIGIEYDNGFDSANMGIIFGSAKRKT
jgi:hypothetical protein